MHDRRRMLVAIVATALMFASGCGGDDDTITEPLDTAESSTAGVGGDPCLSADQGEPADDYVGLDEEAAEDLAGSEGLMLRVVGRDGECMPITMDLRDDRVNVEIVEGTVVAAARF